MNKKEARDILFTLVYEYEFNPEKAAEDLYMTALNDRGFENFRYIKKGLSDIISNRESISQIINSHSDTWKTARIAPVTRSILFVAVYDMVYKNTSCGIAINEAVELAKKYDDSAAVPFINGILNSVAGNLDLLKAEYTSAEESTDNEA